MKKTVFVFLMILSSVSFAAEKTKIFAPPSINDDLPQSRIGSTKNSKSNQVKVKKDRPLKESIKIMRTKPLESKEIIKERKRTK